MFFAALSTMNYQDFGFFPLPCKGAPGNGVYSDAKGSKRYRSPTARGKYARPYWLFK